MKRKLLCVSLVVMSIFGMSCEKNELMSNETASLEGPVSGDTRGGVGGVDGGCVNPTPPSRLIIQKNGQNNGGEIHEGEIWVETFLDSVAVHYDCLPGFTIKNVSVWIGPKALAPVNTSGNPTFGNFQIREKNIDENYHVAMVPRNQITMGPDMIVIAHANVYGHNTESTYGEGPLFTPTGSAMYMNYIPCGW